MKTRIYYYIYAILFLIVFGTYSCSDEFLQYDQRGTQTVGSFYQTDEQAFEALISVFNRWQDGIGWNFLYLQQALSDESYAGGGARGDNGGSLEEINEYRFTPSTGSFKGYYSWMYDCINRSNLVINNVKPDTGNKALCVSMAHAFRGYAYFYLKNMWGEVPLVLKELNPEEYNQPRAPMADINALIVKDFEDAIVTLPIKGKLPANFSQLLSKGAVQTMLAKHYLYEKNYAKAASIFQEIIDSKIYSLYLDYSKILRKESEHGVESVFEINFTTALNYSGWFGSESGFGGWVIMTGPRPEYLPTSVFDRIGIFPMSWGFINPRKETYDTFVKAGDFIRLKSTIIGPEEMQAMGGTYKNPAGFVPYGSDGYLDLKYIGYLSEGEGPDPVTKYKNVGTNFRLIRYADVLLMAAEAYNRLGDDAKARTYVNMVRDRVNLKPLTSTSDNLFEDIKLERKFELAFEGHRYMDLQRWGDGYKVMKDQGKKIPNGLGGYFEPAGAGYKQGRNELLPIPEYEMIVNTALKGHQNPGY